MHLDSYFESTLLVFFEILQTNYILVLNITSCGESTRQTNSSQDGQNALFRKIDCKKASFATVLSFRLSRTLPRLKCRVKH